MKHILFLLIVVIPGFSKANLKVVTTTPDLEALVRSVGQDKVEVSSIAKGTQDIHQIEAKPSFMIRLRNADLVVSQGLELETAWLNPLTVGARNPKILAGTAGFLELGPGLDPIEIPKGNISRSQGDVHPGGNPHFQLDPIRMGQAAMMIAEKLSELDPGDKTFYSQQAKLFQNHLQEKTKLWEMRIKKTGLKEIITYHKTFGYFLDRFGVTGVMELEPKPGIPPTAGHLLDVISVIKKRNIKLVLIENYYDNSAGEKLKQEIPGLVVLRVPVSIGGEPDVKSTEELMEKVVAAFESVKK